MKKQKNTVIADVKAIQAITGWSIRAVEEKAELGQSSLHYVINGRKPSEKIISATSRLSAWVKKNKAFYSANKRKSK